MKRLALALLLLSGCNGRHIGWIQDAPKATAIAEIKLNAELAGVRFTFDDGPNLLNTPKVLDILKKYNLQGTFFVEGINLAGNSEQAIERRDLLKHMNDEGHIIANHSYDHKAFTLLSDQGILWEIERTNKLIEDITNKTVELIRLPYGKSNKKINSILQSRSLVPIFWDIDVREYERDAKTHQYKTKEEILASFTEQYKSLRYDRGQKHMILILHDTKNITPEVLPLILEYLASIK